MLRAGCRSPSPGVEGVSVCLCLRVEDPRGVVTEMSV